jgi:DNA-directed RNA polymerase specialized sigma24 family protein
VNDAEDVAIQTFEILRENRLLVRWVSDRASRLRTLLCGIASRIVKNRRRGQARNERVLQELAAEMEAADRSLNPEDDLFYAAWAEELVQEAIAVMAAEYYRANQGDHVRVLYGRLCERLRVGELAESLGVRATDVINYYRAARERLAQRLQDLVRWQVERYCPPNEVEAEYAAEWRRLGDFLLRAGGLEEAVRRAYDLFDPVRVQESPKLGTTLQPA